MNNLNVPSFKPRTFGAFSGRDSTFNQSDARTLAIRIRDMWRVAGHEVKCWVDTEYVQSGIRMLPVYCVRTNLINGLPPVLVRQRLNL